MPVHYVVHGGLCSHASALDLNAGTGIWCLGGFAVGRPGVRGHV